MKYLEEEQYRENKKKFIISKNKAILNTTDQLSNLKWYKKPIIGLKLLLASHDIRSPFDLASIVNNVYTPLMNLKNLISYFFSSGQPKDFEQVLKTLEKVSEDLKLQPVVIIREIQKLECFKDNQELGNSFKLIFR
jgi:hypothetical protein